MIHAATVLVLALMFTAPSPAAAGFADAVAAYDQGDYTTAFREFGKAADAGDPTAQAVLAHMYAAGQGVSPDQAAAFRWYRKAAEHGLAVAQSALARSYADGRGVERDAVAAVMWFDLAAEAFGAGAARDEALRMGARLAAALSLPDRERARHLAEAWRRTHLK